MTAQSGADSRKWVVVDGLKRFTCPSAECGVVGRFFYRETVPVFETEDGWSRVSGKKSAACYDGASIFVESGPDECTAENGITSGEFAEWVRSKYLADSEPLKPLKRAAGLPGEG
jgi:hypothetical protein